MGGYLVNYFNRFGRQWQVYVEAEGNTERARRIWDSFTWRTETADRVPLSAVTDIQQKFGPEFTMRYNEYHAAQINVTRGAGLQLRHRPRGAGRRLQGDDAAARWVSTTWACRIRRQQAAQGVSPMAIFGLSLLFVFLILAAQYESWSLPFSVLLGTPIAVFGAYLAL